MKVSPAKRSRWLYASLVLMLLALLSFSFLPLASSILQANQPSATSPSPALPKSQAANLETEALGYQAALEREPDNSYALRGLLAVRLQQGDIPGAIEPLAKLAQLNPQEAEYTLLLAQAKQQIGDKSGAESAYRSLLAANPTDMLALKGLTDLLLAQERGTEAISLVQQQLTATIQAQSQQPGDGELGDITSLQLLLGEIYLAQQRDGDALALYDLAMQAAPEDFRPVLAKALLWQQQGKTTAAEPLWQEAIDLSPVEYKDRIKQLKLNQQSPTIDN